jgi:RHS repeat-associated protein
VEKRMAEKVTRFGWDGNDMIAERTDDADVVHWVFGEGYAPVLRAQGTRRHSVVSDHLGTPTALYDEAGALAWRMQLDLLGVAHVEGDAALCPWRWPGQWEDTETGLYYNRFRYYDPATGAYISTDPIGIAGGLSLYGYVADPLGWIDPHGLTDCKRKLRERIAEARKRGNILISRFLSRDEAKAIQAAGGLVPHPARQPTRVMSSAAILSGNVQVEFVKRNKHSYPLRIDIEVTPHTMSWIETNSDRNQIDGHRNAYAIPRSAVATLPVARVFPPVDVQS